MVRLFWIIIFIINFCAAVNEDRKPLRFIMVMGTVCSVIKLATFVTLN